MKNLKIHSLLLILVFTVSCKDGEKSTSADDYAEFRAAPEYITNPTPAQKEYFDAYDKVLQRWDVAYEELYIPTSKGTAHVIMSGPKDGVPVVLFHGMAASSTMWYPNAKTLSKDYRLFAIDLIIEPGKSYKTADFKGLDEVKAWYQEILWALKLDSYHLVGTSRGGWLATNLAIHSKRDIRSLVLLSPAQTIIWIPPTADMFKNALNVFYPKESRIGRTMETLSVNSNRIDADYLDQYRIAKENDSTSKFLIQMKPFSNSDLRKLNMPVLLLIGDDDLFNNQKTLRRAKKLIPNVSVKTISESGHFISVDQAEVVNLEVLDFMKNVDNNR